MNPRTCKRAIGLLAVGFFSVGTTAYADMCNDRDGVHLQVLGSGGPIADDGRASSAYLIWIDGQARVMVDAGGGAFVRFGEAGAAFSELEVVAISHFHTDHSADFITLLKTGFFSSRTLPLAVIGPSASVPFPSLDDWLDSHLRPGEAYSYLGGYLDGSGGLVRLLPETVDASRRDAEIVYTNTDGRLSIEATGVPHGIVPTIGYRISAGGKDIVFASDQNGNDEAFVEFAKDADVLVMHMVVPENAAGAMRALHAPPSRIGEIAAAAGVDTLVLSHFMARSLAMMSENVQLVGQRYDGDIIAADDLMCIAVD